MRLRAALLLAAGAGRCSEEEILGRMFGKEEALRRGTASREEARVLQAGHNQLHKSSSNTGFRGELVFQALIRVLQAKLGAAGPHHHQVRHQGCVLRVAFAKMCPW